VVNNNSTDRTKEIISKLPIILLEENRTQSSYAARNTGVKSAKGEIIAFTDADCVADKNWLKEGVSAFDAPDTGCVAGVIKSAQPANYVEEYLANKNMLSQRESSKFFGFLPYAQTANAFYRKVVFDKTGLFEGKWVSGGDADFCWRMQLQTNYKVSFSDGAVIFHKHRSSAGSLFKQTFKNGIGNSLLEKRYRQLHKAGFKDIIWRQVWFLKALILVILLGPINKKRLSQPGKYSYLGAITCLGRELGRIAGFLKAIKPVNLRS
jgi:cellulose synthase/poly-beta-1,6-N-acetylglucosamine synthase-like glycosyltransferase